MHKGVCLFHFYFSNLLVCMISKVQINAKKLWRSTCFSGGPHCLRNSKSIVCPPRAICFSPIDSGLQVYSLPLIHCITLVRLFSEIFLKNVKTAFKRKCNLTEVN